MSEEFRPIRPKAVDLTGAAEPAASAQRSGRTAGPTVIGLAVALVLASFLIVPRLLPERAPEATTPSAAAPAAAPGTATPEPSAPAQTAPPSSATDGAGMAPYAAQAREADRTAAQNALERFVELELALKAAFTLGDWSDASYSAARDDAARGDDAFMKEQYPAAAEAYTAGAERLEALQTEGRRRLESGLADGASALTARDADAANAAFALAATVAPADPAVVAGLKRADLLPRVNAALRAARNHELAEDWDQALAALAEARTLDPETAGLADIEARLQAALGAAELGNALSQAFAALDAGDDAAARTAFNAALRLDPNNPAARGGLEALSRNGERRQLARLETEASAAFGEERWDDALARYEAALKLDPNVAFAVAGREAVQLRRKALAEIQRILDDRDRLSSANVLQDAESVLARARAITPMSPGLDARIAELADTLARYATPVAVTLRSDNATRVTVSSVGVLGTFDERTLELRPGAYTVMGSRDGCRDVRTRVVVRANMPPIDIRCTETL